LDNGKNEPKSDNASKKKTLAQDKAKRVNGGRNMGKETGEGREERIFTIPLRNVKKAPRWKRSNRAIAEIREYLMRHTKSEDVILDAAINEKVWDRGSQKPPSRIRVKVTEEEDIVKAELVE
jgi:large subunit ribosomal protein L31e